MAINIPNKFAGTIALAVTHDYIETEYKINKLEVAPNKNVRKLTHLRKYKEDLEAVLNYIHSNKEAI